MNYKLHFLAGSLSSLAIIYLFLSSFLELGMIIIIVFYASTIFGSLLPDIDITRSAIGSRVRPLSDVINLLFGHRGITHSFLIAAAIYVIALLLRLEIYGAGIAIGILSHIASDNISKIRIFRTVLLSIFLEIMLVIVNIAILVIIIR